MRVMSNASLHVVLAWTIVIILTGCQDYLVFTTATKFGLEVTQEPEQPPKMLLGYKRSEMAIIPARKATAKDGNDTYSVLGDFCVMANPSLLDFWNNLKPEKEVSDSLHIRSIFATGIAAQKAAENPHMQELFGIYAADHAKKTVSHKTCFPVRTQEEGEEP